MEESTRLLIALTVGFAAVLLAVVGVCTAGGVRWHVLTSSYQVFLIGVFCGGLLTATLVLSVQQTVWASWVSRAVLLGGLLMTGLAQIFFFRILGGDRYVRRLVVLLGDVWG